MSSEKDVIPKFLELYKTEKNTEIKSKLIQGTMIYYQNHRDQIKASSDYQSLKSFYADLLYTELLGTDADNVIRGFIDFHSPQEILQSRGQIDKHCANVEPNLLLGLKHQLASVSKELEAIYIPSMISMLKKYNRSDLDDMFYGIIKMNYKKLSTQAKNEVKAYVNSSATNYFSKSMHGNNDPYFEIAKRSLTDLQKSF